MPPKLSPAGALSRPHDQGHTPGGAAKAKAKAAVKAARRPPRWAAASTDAAPGELIHATFNPEDGLMTYSENGTFARQCTPGGFNSVLFSRECAKMGILCWMIHMPEHSKGRYAVGVCSASSKPDPLGLFSGRETCQIKSDTHPMKGKFVSVAFDCQIGKARFYIGDTEDGEELIVEQTHNFQEDVRLFVAGYMVEARLVERAPKLFLMMRALPSSDGLLAITCHSIGGEELAAMEVPPSQTLGSFRSTLLGLLEVPSKRLNIVTSDARVLSELDDVLPLSELHLAD